jgi:hypothetical protein
MITERLVTALWRRYANRGMLICPVIPAKKLAFVAIPKNAGTSIRVAFGHSQGFVSEGEPVAKVHSKPWPSVSDKATVKILGSLGFLRFCVARNPWERFASCWQDKRENRGNRLLPRTV